MFLLRYTKLLKVLYIVLFFFFFGFFTSSGGVDDVLVRLSLMEQIIKDANLTNISFSVKHPQTFQEL